MVKIESTVNNFLKEIDRNYKQLKFIIGVSGGVDSMVLSNIFMKLNLNIAVAHVNFQLRGNDSDEDEQFVREYFTNRDIPIYIKKVDTNTYAKEHKLSIEQAARELRYDYFEELIEKYNYDYLVLAHQANDVIETFFINILRGATLFGLSSIPQKRSQIIRPLWHVSRKDIENYADVQNIPYRIDKTNNELIFLRNRIRQELLPLINDMRPGVEKTILNNIQILQEQSDTYDLLLKNYLAPYIIYYEDMSFSINFLQLHLSDIAVLHFILSPLSATFDQIQNIIKALPKNETRQFILPNYNVYTQKSTLYVINNHTTFPEITITKNIKTIKEPFEINIKIVSSDELSINKMPHFAFMDIEKINFPLKLRKIKEGDSFVPFGMKSLVKISDFLINQKATPIEKHFQFVLEDATGQIIWLVGRRVSEVVKVDENTKQVFVLESKQKIKSRSEQ
ncbi:MAG: tRNA lysidine(34) synthetase TilS [Bacteroidales bacterium]|nr:tRNA lysidine(34) synthetase TilS [Bacteroidales bacterium]MDI3479127.1 tRNA(Ile)-lysidine synthase [Rikenellaceae bacterium]